MAATLRSPDSWLELQNFFGHNAVGDVAGPAETAPAGRHGNRLTLAGLVTESGGGSKRLSESNVAMRASQRITFAGSLKTSIRARGERQRTV
jgi:hypothetical protein